MPRAIAPPASKKMRRTMSDLDVDDAPEPEPPDYSKDRGDDYCHDPDPPIEEDLHVIRCNREQQHAGNRREKPEDDAAQAPLCRERTDLASDALTLLHRVGNSVEQR